MVNSYINHRQVWSSMQISPMQKHQVQAQLVLHIEFQANKSYIERSCLKKLK